MPPRRGVSVAGPLPEPVEGPLDGSRSKPVEAPFPDRVDGSPPKPVEGPRLAELPVEVSTLIPHSPCPEFRQPGGARHVLPGSVLLFGRPTMRPGAVDSRATRRARTGSTRPHTAVGPVNPAVGRRTRAARDR